MNSKSKDFALVYSTDKKVSTNCTGCNKLIDDCKCKKNLTVAPYKPAINIERKGRGGKCVTIASKLPAHETYLKGLCAYLKSAVGAGGTYYIKDHAGIIEIQGERKEQILNLIEQYKNK